MVFNELCKYVIMKILTLSYDLKSTFMVILAKGSKQSFTYILNLKAKYVNLASKFIVRGDLDDIRSTNL